MTRIVLIAATVVLLNIFAGCQPSDSGRGQLMPSRTAVASEANGAVQVRGAGEADVVEEVVVNRQAYRRALAGLLDHYTRTGNNMKLKWVRRELNALDRMPQYKYIIEAEGLLPGLKATDSIPEADELYAEALEMERRAGPLVILKDNEMLRLALDKYNQLIRRYPTSDKIDDATYHAGGIYEYFNDYTIAVLYFKKAFESDPATPYPARSRAAFLLDQRLHRRTEALTLYQESVVKESQHEKWRVFGEKRIKQLTKTEEEGA
jgi:tetratricopeptide (TPR) repeat protein